MKKYAIFLIPIVVFLIYSGVLLRGKFVVHSDDMNYFKNLSISFMQGKTDVEVHAKCAFHDLVTYKGKQYLYWPPIPALVYIPFTLIWGTNTPDTLINNLFGTANIVLLIIFLQLFSKRFGLNLMKSEIGFLAIFWALGTVHFYMSRVGSVWYVSQVMAQTFLLLSMIFIMKGTDLKNVMLSGLFFGLAAYTKNNLVFACVFHATVYLTGVDKTKWKKILLMFLLPFIMFSFFNMAYNVARFGNIFENGIKYHNMGGHFSDNYNTHGYLSPVYIQYNFITEVMMPPPYMKEFPFFMFNVEGFGFFWASPVFFISLVMLWFLLVAASKYYLKRRDRKTFLSPDDTMIMSGSLIAGSLIALVIFMIMGTGWVQFASRYSLDYQIFVLIPGLFVLKKWRDNRYFIGIANILLLISIHMNYFGMKYYLGL